MHFLTHIVDKLGHLLRGHIPEAALGVVATLIFVYGDEINGLIKKQIQGYHFLIRLLIFVLLCTFGYGALTIFLSKVIAGFLDSLDPIYLASVLIVFFVFVGILAERKKQM